MSISRQVKFLQLIFRQISTLTNFEVNLTLSSSTTHCWKDIEFALLLVVVLLNSKLYWKNYDHLKVGCSIVNYIVEFTLAYVMKLQAQIEEAQ